MFRSNPKGLWSSKPGRKQFRNLAIHMEGTSLKPEQHRVR